MVSQQHYSRGGSNTATYRHGLYRLDDFFTLYGIAWWIPPTRSAAEATYPQNWEGVLALHRLVVDPEVPTNGASFLIGASMRMIDRKRWPCLVTYADEWQGHTGAIYRATNWTYAGRTMPESQWILKGRAVSRKAGPTTRTTSEMKSIGAEKIGRFAKHKFVHIAG